MCVDLVADFLGFVEGGQGWEEGYCVGFTMGGEADGDGDGDGEGRQEEGDVAGMAWSLAYTALALS